MLSDSCKADGKTKARRKAYWCVKKDRLVPFTDILEGASSVYGKRGVSYSQAYCAAKFAVRGLSQSVGELTRDIGCAASHADRSVLAIAREMMPYKITCNSYAPGLIYTDLSTCLRPISHPTLITLHYYS